MKKYNLNTAEQLLNNFVGLTGFDITETKRTTEKVCTRSFFNFLLHKMNNMTAGQIEDFYKHKGGSLTRLSIRHSLSRKDFYHENFEQFRKYYDNYFPSVDVKRKSRLENNDLMNDELFFVIDSIREPFRRAEMLEMVKLRIKSWEWKYRDECTVYDCSSDMSSLTF